MSAPARSASPLKILIVEDNQDARTTLRMMLSLALGHTVLEAASGAAAVQAAIDERPDVALIDLGLPDIDGHEVARRIRMAFDPSAIMLIALTGYGMAEDFVRTREAGFDVHLVKPVDFTALERLFASRGGAQVQSQVAGTP
jgi:two-component system, sensor histidine kinase